MLENLSRAAFLGLVEAGAAAASLYHRARLHRPEVIPSGPVLLVGNHGVYGYETPIFFYLLLQATGRYPLGLAERGFFKIPFIRRVLPWIGGVEGTREKALQALAGGELVVCYPGGAREVFKGERARYVLRWERSTGFVRTASLAGARIIPFGAHGVDDTFFLTPHRLGQDEKYSIPVGLGLGPLPLPTRLSFVLGQPHRPPAPDATDDEVANFRDHVAATVRRLVVEAAHA